MISAPLLLLLLLPAEDKPTPKLPLGKETTYVTGPLDKDGYIDYEAALNDRLGKGITSGEERQRPALEGIRSRQGAEIPEEFFKRLGIARPPEKGDYFIGLNAYLRDHVKLEPGARSVPLLDPMVAAGKRPWTAKDYPHLAGWLKFNEKPLALIIEATRRPDYFSPLISRKTEKEPGY